MKKIALIFLLAITFASCGVKSDDLKITSFDGGSLSKIGGSSAQVTFKLGVANDSRRSVVVKSADFYITDADCQSIASISIPEKIIIPRRSTSQLEIPVRVKFQGLLGALTAVAKFNDIENLKITGVVKVKSGLLTKKIEIKNRPIKEILSNFDSSILEKFKL